MAWKQRLTDGMASRLRFGSLGALLIGGISLSVAFVYVLVKTCWFTVCYLNRTWFALEPLGKK